MHVRGDGVVPFEEGRLLAALIPRLALRAARGDRPHPRPGRPCVAPFFDEVRAFLAATSSGVLTGRNRPGRLAPARDPALDTLSDREREVMRFVAEGRRNAEIADALVLSPRTVERHLSNVYAKLGIEGKAARAAAAARVSRAEPR